MKILRTLTGALWLSLFLCSQSPCLSMEESSEVHRRRDFLAAYNQRTAHERFTAIQKLEGAKEDRSIEMLYFVSWKDPDPEVRSRAFSTLVLCDDTYGYTAYLAADSFKRETELGVKVEMAVAMGSLKYKWSALNELVDFLRTLRWQYYNWSWYGAGRSAGYIASGNPPVEPGGKNAERGSGDDYGRGQEPLRWHSERELMGIIAEVINRLSGTRIESRPRIDQEIVKWWDRKSALWAAHDRRLRTKTLKDSRDSKEIQWKDLKNMKNDEVVPGKDIIPGNDIVRKFLIRPTKMENLRGDEKVRQAAIEDE